MRVILHFALVLVLFLSSCKKELPDPGLGSASEVVFAITDGRSGLKSTANCAFDVDYAMVIISHIVKKKQVNENYFTGTQLIDGILYTLPIKLPTLPSGQYYKVEECLLYSDDNKVYANPNGDQLISAAPHSGSNFGLQIPNPLNVQFTINAFNKTDVGLSVFCFEGSTPGDYGFIWFQPSVIVVKQKWFYGSFSPGNYLDYTGSSYDLAGQLAVDMPAIYKILVYRDNDKNGLFSETELLIQYGNEAKYLSKIIEPMSVQYADAINGANHFEIRFLAYIKTGNGLFTYQKVGSLYFEDEDPNLFWKPISQRNPLVDTPINPGADNIFEFIIGNSTGGTADFRFGY